MLRKWTILAAMMTTVALTASGLSWADDDDDSPLHKIMEQVSTKNNIIKKALRSPVAYKKAMEKKDVVKDADTLLELGKKAREIKEPSEKEKKPFAEWQRLADDWIKKTEDFKTLVAKGGSTPKDQAAAKKAYTSNVAIACAACHKVFKPDVDDDK